MTPSELKSRQIGLVGEGKSATIEMAKLLKTPYQTYWNWLNGLRRIPGVLEVAIDGLEFKRANMTTRG